MPAASKTIVLMAVLVCSSVVCSTQAQTQPPPNTPPHSAARATENEVRNEPARSPLGQIPFLPVDITKIDPHLLQLGLRCIGQLLPMTQPITDPLTNLLQVVAPAGGEARAADSLERLFGEPEKPPEADKNMAERVLDFLK